MSINLLQTVKDYFTGEFTDQASSSLGENQAGISKALSAIIPTGLSGILGKLASGTDGINDVYSMAKNAIGSISGGTAQLAEPANQERGSTILSNLYGGSKSMVVNAISSFAGIKGSSASSLMNMGLSGIMGLLGKHAEENNLSAEGLAGLLASQKDEILGALPAGWASMGSMMGIGTGPKAPVKPTVTDTTHAVHTGEDKPGGAKWLLPLIIILAAIALIWYFAKGCNETTPATEVVSDTPAVVVQTPDAEVIATPMLSESIKVQLPNGKELAAYKGGIEDQLVAFLKTDWKAMSKDDLKAKWFNFDNLNFTTGTATLVPESEKQLDNIAEVLKAFPDAKIKIGGYTDATGDAAVNKKVSKDRANAAKDGLEKRGVGNQVTEAEGYGSEFAKAAATAPDAERALDRHVSVSVRK